MFGDSSGSDDEQDRDDLSDFDDGASMSSQNLDKNFRGAMKNMLFGIADLQKYKVLRILKKNKQLIIINLILF